MCVCVGKEFDNECDSNKEEGLKDNYVCLLCNFWLVMFSWLNQQHFRFIDHLWGELHTVGMAIEKKAVENTSPFHDNAVRKAPWRIKKVFRVI